MAFLLKPMLLLSSARQSSRQVVRFLRICGAVHQQSESCRKTGYRHEETISPAFRLATNHIGSGRVAIKDKHGAHSYKEVLVKALKLARKIREKIGPNKSQERIVFLCPNDVTYVLAQWACWAAGHIAVPLSAVHPPSLLAYYIKDSDAALAISCYTYSELMTSVTSHPESKVPLLVIDDSWAKSIPTPGNGNKSKGSQYSSVRVDDNGSFVDHEISQLLTDCSMPEEFYQTAHAMILYTSGTTGKPKGVLLSHGNVDSQVRSLIRAWAWSPADVIVHTLPLHHTHGIVNALLCPLYVGARCIMLPKFDASIAWSYLLGVGMSASERPTVFMAVPTIYSKLLDEYDRTFAANAKLKEHVRSICSSKIRLMVSGSAPLPEPIFNRWHSVTGHCLLERYGMTEIGMALSNPLKGERRPGHVGMPLPDVKVRIADFKNASSSKGNYDILAEGNFKATKVEPGKAGMSGELLIKGPSVFQGYWNNPEATFKEFTKDGWFKTGDIAEFGGGYYKILGRASADIIKSGGYKISALQIETELLSHPHVADCAVVGVSDPIWGQKVAAVLVLKKRLTSGRWLDELRDWCLDKMPPYTVPREWVVLESLPRNAMGKVNKKQLVKSVFPAS